MKYALIESIILIAPLSMNPKQKEPIMESFTEVEKEVRDQFNQLVSAINQMNAGEWSKFYTNLEQITSTQKIHGVKKDRRLRVRIN
jgi:hypothetical protein